ncbi:hypothetical protein PI124_g13254 [Phytophthora idaei]|nr:hypothetical protein PI124_g13254 [Phytophthora idaei]
MCYKLSLEDCPRYVRPYQAICDFLSNTKELPGSRKNINEVRACEYVQAKAGTLKKNLRNPTTGITRQQTKDHAEGVRFAYEPSPDTPSVSPRAAEANGMADDAPGASSSEPSLATVQMDLQTNSSRNRANHGRAAIRDQVWTNRRQ